MHRREFVSAGIELMPRVPRARCQAVMSAMIGAGWRERVLRGGAAPIATEMAEERLVRMMPDLAHRRLGTGRHRALFDKALAQAEAVLGDSRDGGAADLVLTASARRGQEISHCHVLLHIALVCGVPILDFAHDSISNLSPAAILQRISDPVFLAGMAESNRQARGHDRLEMELARMSVGLYAAQKRIPYDQAAARFVEAGALRRDSPLLGLAHDVAGEVERLGRQEPHRLIFQIGDALAGQRVVQDRGRMTPGEEELDLQIEHAKRLSTQVGETGVARAADMAQVILPAEAAGVALLQQGAPATTAGQLISLSAGLSASMAMRDIDPIEVAERRVRPIGAAMPDGAPRPAPAAPQAAAHFDRAPGRGTAKASAAVDPDDELEPAPLVTDAACRAAAGGLRFAQTINAMVAERALDATDPRVQLDPARYARDAHLTPETLILNLADAIEAPVPTALAQQSTEPELSAALAEARRQLRRAARYLDSGAVLDEARFVAVLRALERAALAALGHPAARAFGETALIRLAGLTDSLVERRTANAGAEGPERRGNAPGQAAARLTAGAGAPAPPPNAPDARG